MKYRTLKLLASGGDVELLQGYLQGWPKPLTPEAAEEIDQATFGEATQAVVIAFQKANNLDVDGIVGRQVWSTLIKNLTPLREMESILDLPTTACFVHLDRSHNKSEEVSNLMDIYEKYHLLIETLSNITGIPYHAAMAVIAVESAGKGMVDDRMVIRFETHLFDRYKSSAKVSQEQFDSLYSYNPSFPWLDQTFVDEKFHGVQALEWKAFLTATELDFPAAIKSISMGAPQILGSNYSLVKFNTPFEFYEYMSASEENQIIALFEFVINNPEMHAALIDLDWYSFARLYNGPGQAVKYSEWLEKRYKTALTICP